METKVIIFDSNSKRGENIVEVLQKNGLSSSHYKQFDGSDANSLTGIWNTHKVKFIEFIKSYRYIFIHYSNDQYSYAINEIQDEQFVIVYSGGGNVTLSIMKSNIFPFQGKVNDDAKTEWDLTGFANALLSGSGNLIEALKRTDEELEKLLEPFVNALPLDENWKGTTLQAEKDKLIMEVNKKLKQ